MYTMGLQFHSPFTFESKSNQRNRIHSGSSKLTSGSKSKWYFRNKLKIKLKSILSQFIQKVPTSISILTSIHIRNHVLDQCPFGSSTSLAVVVIAGKTGVAIIAADQWRQKLLNQSINQSISQLINQPVNPIDRSIRNALSPCSLSSMGTMDPHEHGPL